MTAEQGVWSRIRDLRNPPEGPFEPHPGVLEYKGWFKMLRIDWSTSGQDEHGTKYDMSVLEHEPWTISSTWFGARHLMIADMTSTLERPGGDMLESRYIARFRAGNLLGVAGYIEFEDENHHLTSDQASAGFLSALELAEFEPVELEPVRPFPQLNK